MTSPGDRLITDGAECGDTLRWGVINNMVASTAQKRTGNYSYQFSNSGAYYATSKPFTALTEYNVRFSWRATTPVASSFFKLLNGASSVAHDLRLISYGSGNSQVGVYDGSTLRGSSSLFSMLSVEWHVFEMYGKIHASSGSFQVKFDGTPILSFTGQTNAQPGIDRVQVLGNNGGNSWYDDIAVDDRSGLGVAWINDGGVLAPLVPTGAGTYSDLLASSGSAWQCIDEIPNSDIDYVYESTVDKKSTYQMSDLSGLPAGASIARVWVSARAKQSASSGDKIGTELLSGATLGQGADQALTVSTAEYLSAYYLVDPADSAAWTTEKVNALEAGAIVR